MTIPADIIERARDTDIVAVVERYGLKLKRAGIELKGPCPLCGGSDRFWINTRRQIWGCRGCGKGGDVIALRQHIDGSTFAEAVHTLAGTVAAEPAQNLRTTCANLRSKADDGYAREQARKAAWLWDHRQPIAGSIAETYLREARGYDGPIPPTLGFLPPREGRHPAMIAAFALVGETEPGILAKPIDVASVHLTLLKIDGTGKAEVKPNKIIVGSPVGCPITLAPVNDLLGLAVTEGIEDGLSVAWSLGLGTWAAGAAGFMSALADTVPGYVECCTIFGHADPAGRRGARALADRLVARGLEVFIEGV
jgi:hypothetical protein